MSYKPTAETLKIVERLGGTWHGAYGMCRCPAHEDSEPSLSIKQGRTSILVHCFAGCEGGDIMSAIRHVLGSSVARQEPERAPYRPKRLLHLPLWDTATPIDGTLAEKYLKDIRGITFIPNDVRFHPRCPKGKSPKTEFLPALLVGIFKDGTLIAVQRIFLDPRTARYTAKMILGDSRGGSWPSGFSGEHMAIAEGFETACAYQQITDQEAGTCFGTRNFPIFEPPEGISRITHLPDNDAEGLAFVQKATEVRKTQGYLTRTKLCPANFKDWADILAPHSDN
jgi:hypothetical protein